MYITRSADSMLWYIIETLVIYHRGFISRLTQDAIRNRQEPHLQEQEEQGSVIACKKSRRVTDLCGRATYKGEAVSGYGQPLGPTSGIVLVESTSPTASSTTTQISVFASFAVNPLLLLVVRLRRSNGHR